LSQGAAKTAALQDMALVAVAARPPRTPPVIPVAISGTWTPASVGVANVDALVDHVCNYSRVGNRVSFDGMIDIDPTLTATLTTVSIPLPVPSDFTVVNDCNGVASCIDALGAGGVLYADTAGDQITFDLISVGIVSARYHFTGGYTVK